MLSKFPRIYILYTTILISVLLLAYTSNPPNGRTNAPGDGYCADCHLPGNPLGLDGELTIENFPSSIDPNTDYTITVRLTNPNGLAAKAGFQAVVLDGDDQNIGDLSVTSTNPSTTTTGSREYVEHTPAKNFPVSNEVTWDFVWTSPNGPDGEEIKMYAAGNIANGGAGNANDLIRSTNVSGTLIGGSSLTVSILFSSNVSCAGGQDGTATALATDGTPGYTYLWPNGTTNATVNNLAAGSHTVTVTDNAGATATATAIIVEPDPVVGIVTSSTITCTEPASTAVATVTGGTQNYNYLWSSGGTSAIETGLTAGTYTLTITDANGCSYTETFSPPVDNTPPIADAGPDQQLTCSSTTVVLDGSNSSIGSSIDYFWTTTNGNILNGTTTNTATVNQAGTYTLNVVDLSTGCQSSSTVEVTSTGAPFLSITPTPVSCAGGNDGSIDLLINNGQAPYTYEWNDTNLNGIEDPIGLSAGEYCVTVTDDNDCEASTCVTIMAPNPISITGNVYNISCNGDCDGSIEVTASGGTGTYTYTWNTVPVQTTPNIYNLCAGTYTVTVTDDNNCTATATFVVDEPSALGLEGLSLPVSCNGLCDGSIQTAVIGGTSPYTYLWSNGSTDSTPNNLCAGTYTFTVTDDNGCTATSLSITVEEPSAIAISGTTNMVCPGNCDGTITVNASGGTGNYTYTWNTSPPQLTSSISGLCAGTYTVIVTDDNGCTAEASFSITENPMMLIAYTIATPSCNGGCDGGIMPSISGGVPPYIFQWSNGATACDIQDICAGIYTVTVTDAAGCTASESMDVGEPMAISITSSFTGPSCNNQCDATIDITVEGGTGDFVYDWGIFGNSEDITGLCAGTYTVTVTDENNCTEIHEVNISSPSGLSVDYSILNPTCNNVCDGSVNLEVTGGTSPYTYLWDNGSTDDSFQNICTGFPTVTITDDNGCTAQITIEVTEPSAIEITATSTETTCGQCNGSINTTVIGGTGPYNYSWSNPIIDGLEDPDNLCAGNYTLTVTDGNNCTATYSISVISANGASVSGNVTDTNCSESCDGSIDLLVSGEGPFVFDWGDALPDTQDQVDLCAGDYNVTVTDNNGCSLVASFLVQEPDPIIITTTTNPISCNGECDGDIPMVVIGGTQPFTFLWSDGSNQCDLNNICAGTYTVTVTDANGCTATASQTIEEPEAITINILTTDASPGGADGMAEAMILTGNVSPFTYEWNDASNQMTALATGLVSGTYCVTVTDGNNCSIVQCATVGEGNCDLTGSISGTGASCFGSCDGSIELLVSGSGTPFDFDWGDALPNTQNQIGLCAGDYTVTVTDNNACTLVASFTIQEPESILITTSTNPISCNGECDGDIPMAVIGGTEPFTFLWSDGSTQCDLSNACAGTYTVTVTDANGCTATASQTIEEPEAITINILTTDASPGGSDGMAEAVILTGSIPPFTYLWNDVNSQTTATATGLTAGTYCVTITDNNNCSVEQCATVGESGCNLAGNISGTDPSCFGLNDGVAAALAVGGTEPFEYNWSNGDTTMNNTGLIAGIYMVTITDAANCSIVLSVTLSDPPPISITSSTTDVSCNGSCDGTVDLLVTGGTPPYLSFSWDGGCVGQNPVDVCAGTFTVTITDANACTVTHTVTIAEPAPITLEMSSTDVSAPGAMDGTATVQASGGAPGYTEAWSNGVLGQTTISDLSPGNYCVTITDANNCSETNCVSVGTPGCTMTIEVTSTTTTCFGECGGAIDLTINNGVAPITYLWSGGGIGDIEDPVNLCAGNYSVTATDAQGCSVTASTSIIENSAMTVIFNYTLASCTEVCNGMIDVMVEGGTLPYTYLWSNGETTEDISGLCEGNDYLLTVTDALGCIATEFEFFITALPGLNVEPNVINTNCFDSCDGGITVDVSGGTFPFGYDWDMDQYDGESVITDLCADTYFVTVTDAVGCSSATFIEVESPDDLTIILNTTSPACFGACDGSVDIILSGGTIPYTVDWDGQDPDAFCPGDYSYTLTDANGCTKAFDFTIDENPEIVYTLDMVMGDVNQQGNGSIDISVSGGTAPFSFVWYQQDPPNDPIIVSMEEDPDGLSFGSYYCDITDENGCLITTGFISVDDIVNTLELAWANQINVFPNPVNDVLNIQYDLNDPLDVVLEVFDVRGVRVLVQNTQTNNFENGKLDFSDLANGVYTLRISSADSFYTYKIVKMEF